MYVVILGIESDVYMKDHIHMCVCGLVGMWHVRQPGDFKCNSGDLVLTLGSSHKPRNMETRQFWRKKERYSKYVMSEVVP